LNIIKVNCDARDCKASSEFDGDDEEISVPEGWGYLTLSDSCNEEQGFYLCPAHADPLWDVLGL
jgi:hypothetical protein